MRLFPQQAAKGDYRGDTGKVEEDYGGDSLDMETVPDVTPVQGISLLHIPHQATTKPEQESREYRLSTII